MKKTAVVILNYNGKKHLETFLPNVIRCSEGAEIVVADNGSTDDSLAYLKTFGEAIEIIVLDKNYGFAEGYNQALKNYCSDYYILLNSDIEVNEGWISPLVKMLESDEKIAACQPKILSYKDKTKFEHAGAGGGWMDFFAYPFCRGRVFYETENDLGQYDDESEIFWASGAAMCIKAKLFHGLGGFDGDYFAHMEEIDLCWRAKKAGFRIMVAPSSVVYHVGGGTLDYLSTFKSFLNFRNSLMTILKNESALKLVWFLPFRMILDGFAAGMYLIKGEFRFIWTILRAHFAFYFSFFSTLKKRRINHQLIENQRIAPENKVGILNKSIVWNYFFKKKKTFRDIFQ
jgi:GT2 family glycosyltransferase